MKNALGQSNNSHGEPSFEAPRIPPEKAVQQWQQATGDTVLLEMINTF